MLIFDAACDIWGRGLKISVTVSTFSSKYAMRREKNFLTDFFGVEMKPSPKGCLTSN